MAPTRTATARWTTTPAAPPRARPAPGRCVDPARTSECGDDLRCVEGVCLTPCDLAECARSARAAATACVSIPCVGVDCAAGERRAAGECGPDACERTGCPDGEVRAAGLPDRPMRRGRVRGRSVSAAMAFACRAARPSRVRGACDVSTVSARPTPAPSSAAPTASAASREPAARRPAATRAAARVRPASRAVRARAVRRHPPPGRRALRGAIGPGTVCRRLGAGRRPGHRPGRRGRRVRRRRRRPRGARRTPRPTSPPTRPPRIPALAGAGPPGVADVARWTPRARRESGCCCWRLSDMGVDATAGADGFPLFPGGRLRQAVGRRTPSIHVIRRGHRPVPIPRDSLLQHPQGHHSSPTSRPTLLPRTWGPARPAGSP